MANKKELPPEQRKELLATLKTRFEKNMPLQYRQSWKPITKNYGRSTKWK
jgi:hypothetical protein